MPLISLNQLKDIRIGPPGTGYNDTVRIEEFLNDTSSDALALGRPLTAVLRKEHEYNVDGINHPEFVILDGNGSTLKKVTNANYSESMFTSNKVACIKAKWILKNGSWYGSARRMGLKNIILDSNNKNYLAVMDYMNAEDLDIDNVTMIAGLWSLNWTTRISGKRININNFKILGATRVFQDGLHILYGEDIRVTNGYVESGDDGVATGDDQVTANVYCDDQSLKNFSVRNVTVVSTRGNGYKAYTPASKPFSALGYTKTGKVYGGKVHIIGKAGILRNGAISFMNHATPDNRVVNDLRDITVHVNIETGFDGKGVYSAVPGIIIGTPTAVTAANPVQVSLAGHGLVTGEVVSFIDIPSDGMQNLVGFYQVRSPATDTLQLSDNAFRSNVGLDGSTFTAWTSGKLIKCSAGTGYKVGEDLTINGGTFDEPAVYRVTQVDGNGAVQAVRAISRGKYSVLPSTPNSPTGGSGTGCILHLELSHSGINSHGLHSIGTSDITVNGRIDINDTTGTAQRFEGAYLIDTQSNKLNFSLPNVPANGGVWVTNESTIQKSKDNLINCHMVCTNMPSTTAAITLHNSENTTISGLIEELATNAFAIRLSFSGNVWQTKTISNISASASAAAIECAYLGWKQGDFVSITGNVLSVGSANGFYSIGQIVNSTTITLKDLDGNNFILNGATVTTPGNISLANNTLFVQNLTVRKAAGATGVVGIGAASNSPPRATYLNVSDCDFAQVDNPIEPNASSLPIVRVRNVEGLSYKNRNYRATSITHNVLVGDNVTVLVPDADVTINAPLYAKTGDELTFTIRQSATARTIIWNSIFKKDADAAGISSGVGSIKFKYDGTFWIQQGSALTYRSLA